MGFKFSRAGAGTVGALFLSAALLSVGALLAPQPTVRRRAPAWDPRSAASYLDSRLVSWTHGGAMDHGAFCISCHTGLPYALARSAIRPALGEREPSQPERQLLDSVTTRVHMWSQVQPYLGDKNGGLGTESVLNALILASNDAPTGHMSETTRQALRIMWSYQHTSGDGAGAWPWINAGNEPWEAPDSDYWGAALAAAAVGIAPEGYARAPQIQGGIKLLEAYLRRPDRNRSLLNRVAELWASTKLPGLISAESRTAIVSDILAKQGPDGGWNTASLIPADWKRHDGTAQESKSDGYATGYVTFVLGQAGLSRSAAPMRRAIAWLECNQDPSTGAWPTASPNSTRNPATDVGKFMTDAATAYSVLALSSRG